MRFILAVVLFSLAAVVQAQPYVAADFGHAEAGLRGQDASGSSSTFAAGYRFTPHLAGELSYLDSDGRTDVRATTLFWKSRGYGLAAIGSLPVGRWSLLGKVGAYRLKTSTRELVTLGGVTVRDDTVTRSHWSPSVAVGAQFNIAENVSMRAMVERVDGKGELDRLRIVTLAAVVVFR